jgi:Spherulation-specific family 4
MVVINIADGPGTDLIPEYVPALHAARRAGIDIVGYVDTDNGHRPHSDVLVDIARYQDWYNPNGYLFDRADVAGTDVHRYYAPLRDWVKAYDSSHLCIVNPGVGVDEAFMAVADIVVDFEGPCGQYLIARRSMPKWRSKYEPTRFWHIVYDVPASLLQTVVAVAKDRRAGWVYLTDQPIADAQPGAYLYNRLPNEATWGRLALLLRPSSR